MRANRRHHRAFSLRRPYLRLFLIGSLLSVPLSLPAAAGELTSVLSGGEIAPALHGVWASRGYGWIIEVPAEGRLRLYDHNAHGCTGEEVPREELASFARLFSRDGEVLRVVDRAENATVYTMDRIAAVPSVCGEARSTDPPSVLRHFSSLMAEHYAFFDVHEVDWSARSRQAAARVSAETGESELFGLMEEMLDGIRDGHLRLGGEVDGEERRVRPGRAAVGFLLDDAFDAQRRYKDKGKFQRAWYQQQRKQVRKKLLGKSYRSAADGQAVWGHIGEVGYLGVFGMGGFGGEESDSIDEELAAVHAVIGRAVSELRDTKAMIVDVTLNGGGMDIVSLAIAGHFTKKQSLAFSKYAKDASGAEPQPFHVLPADSGRYLKPVTLLTSNFTVSAAEIFTMAMRSLPQVTHRGEATRGALSDVLEKELLNGWILTLSNEVYLDAEDVLWEGLGIPPTEEAPVFDGRNIETSRAEAIRSAARSLEALAADSR